MARALAVALGLWLAADIALTRLLEPVGLGALHAPLAMVLGMGAGGYLAGRRFVPVGLLVAALLSAVTFVGVARLRGQPVLELVASEPLAVTAGPLVGAGLGALLGAALGQRRRARGPA